MKNNIQYQQRTCILCSLFCWLVDDRQLHRTTFLSSSCFFSLLLSLDCSLSFSHTVYSKGQKRNDEKKKLKRKKHGAAKIGYFFHLCRFLSSIFISFSRDFFCLVARFFVVVVSLLLFSLLISLPSSSFSKTLVQPHW